MSGRRFASVGAGAAVEFEVDLPRRDLAEVQVRRQARRAVTRGQVAARARSRRCASSAKTSSSSRAPASPGCQFAAAHRPRQCAAAVQAPPAAGCRAVRANRARVARAAVPTACSCAAQVAPVRREHLVRLALLRGDLPRLAPQRGVVAVHRDAVAPQRALDARVAGDRGRLVQPVPVHRTGAAVRDQRAQDLQRLAATQVQCRAGARAARASSAASEWCSHQRLAAPADHGPSSSAWMNTGSTRVVFRTGRAPRRIVGQPQVAPEQHQRRAHRGRSVRHPTAMLRNRTAAAACARTSRRTPAAHRWRPRRCTARLATLPADD